MHPKQERVPLKTTKLTGDLSVALERRGVDPEVSILAAQVGMAASGHAVKTCSANPEPGLDAQLTRALALLLYLAPPAVRKPDLL